MSGRCPGCGARVPIPRAAPEGPPEACVETTMPCGETPTERRSWRHQFRALAGSVRVASRARPKLALVAGISVALILPLVCVFMLLPSDEEQVAERTEAYCLALKYGDWGEMVNFYTDAEVSRQGEKLLRQDLVRVQEALKNIANVAGTQDPGSILRLMEKVSGKGGLSNDRQGRAFVIFLLETDDLSKIVNDPREVGARFAAITFRLDFASVRGAIQEVRVDRVLLGADGRTAKCYVTLTRAAANDLPLTLDWSQEDGEWWLDESESR